MFISLQVHSVLKLPCTSTHIIFFLYIVLLSAMCDTEKVKQKQGSKALITWLWWYWKADILVFTGSLWFLILIYGQAILLLPHCAVWDCHLCFPRLSSVESLSKNHNYSTSGSENTTLATTIHSYVYRIYLLSKPFYYGKANPPPLLSRSRSFQGKLC